MIDELGGPRTYNHYPVGWAHAMDTPMQWTEQVASHFGGTANAMVISWPARIKDKGGLRSQFCHVIDIVPTIYEAAKISPPDVLYGVEQKPIRGREPRLYLRRRQCSHTPQHPILRDGG
jgi:arylsulfatase